MQPKLSRERRQYCQKTRTDLIKRRVRVTGNVGPMSILTSALKSGLTPDPMAAPPLRWGIIGAGGIASTFARAVTEYTASTIAAVGSRDEAKAQEFANKFLREAADQAAIYGSYEELVADPSIDAVYVGTPHSHHRDHALLAINAGKHVLVEKAFARNVEEAREIFAAAKERGVFAMEAMWTRFLPHVAVLHDLINRGEIGEISTIIADHGQFFEFDPEHRLFNPELAGGAMLDLGIYPVSFAYDFLGTPKTIIASGQKTPTDVDGQVSMIFDYDNNAQASLHTTLWSRTPTTAAITGTKGRIIVQGSFYAPTTFELVKYNGEVSTYERDDIFGLEFEAAEVARCIARGLTESPLMTWQNTLDVMVTLDEVRTQIDLVFPGE